MKRFMMLLTALVLLSAHAIKAQEMRISGANLIITENVVLNIKDMDLILNEMGGKSGIISSGGEINLNANMVINTLANPFHENLGKKGTIIFYGTGNSDINGSFSESFMQNLTIDKTTGGLFLYTPVGVTGTLNLQNGIINNNDINGVLILDKNAVIVGGDENSHVKGYMGRIADIDNNNFMFPVGTGTILRPIGFYDLSGAATVYARHVVDNPLAGWDLAPWVEGNEVDGKLIERVTDIEYWELFPDNSVAAGVVLTWDDPYSEVEYPEYLLAAVWNTDKWRNLGAKNIDGFNNIFESYNTTEIFGDFALASALLPPILGDVNNDGNVNVLDVVWMVRHLTGDTPYGFVYNNGDITGGGITAADLTALIDIILDNYNPKREMLSNTAQLFLHEDGNVSFISDGTLPSLNFELLSHEIDYIEIEKTILTNHKISFNKDTGIGIIYSINNTVFDEGEIDLMKLSGLDLKGLDWGHTIASNVAYQLVDVKTHKFEDATTSEDLEFDKFNLSLYPNPNVGNFNINLQIPEDNNLTIEVFDEIGRSAYKIEESKYTRGKHSLEMNLATTLRTGMYFMRVYGNDPTQNTIKMIHEEKIVIVK